MSGLHSDANLPLEVAIPKSQTPGSLALSEVNLAKFLSVCHRRRYPTKTAIFRPGDPANTLYYVIDGALTVASEDENGRELILAYINKGDFIGELGLFVETHHREVLVKSRSACELAEVSYERLVALFEGPLKDECPRVLFAIGSQLTRRLLHTSRKVSRLAFMDVTSRIARTLIDLCSEPEAMTHPKGTQIRISRQEISRIVGCSREMAGRVLKQLQIEGKLWARGKTIVVFGTRG